MPITEKIYLTIIETAEILRVHPRTVRRYIRTGALPSIVVGNRLIRIPAAAVMPAPANDIAADDRAPAPANDGCSAGDIGSCSAGAMK